MIIEKAQENLRKYGRQLLIKTKLDFDEYSSKCQDFEQAINIKPKDIDSLKSILEKIS